MKHFIDAALGRTRTVLMTLALILIAGWGTYNAIPKEAEPDINIPFIYTLLSHDGISPEDAERLLVRPVEQELRSIEGVKEMTATAFEGGASVTLEFEAGVDTDIALQDVREKVDAAKSELPDETEEPSVHEVKISREDPMLIMDLSGSVPERQMVKIARDLKEKIEGVGGVLEVDISGDREELLEVVVDPLLLESYGLSYQDIFNFVDRNNRLVAAGSLDGAAGKFPVKVPGVFEDPIDVLELPIKVEDDRVVHFQDVATVRRTYKDRTSFARIDGTPAIELEIVKRAGANIIDTVEQVRAVVAEESLLWPAGINVTYVRDKSNDIRSMLSDLQNNVLSAVLLVVIVIIGILGFRTAGLVGIAIPGSFLAGIMILGVIQLTVNIVVLFSLIMAVGMLVDGAIVVTEFADRKMAEGMNRRQAYAAASSRMAWPIIASTATTLAAFAPLVFWPGIVGEFMKYLPITLIATLSASLAMALIFVPALGSIFGKPGAMSDKARKSLAAAETGDIESIGGFTGRYLHFLKGALAHPWKILLGAFALLIGIYVAFGTFGKGTEFFPDVEPEFAFVNIYARGDLSTQEQDHLVKEIETRILDMPEFQNVSTRVGAGGRGSREDQIGRLTLQFVDWELRRPAVQILQEVRDRTTDLAGVEIETRSPNSGPGGGKPINIQLSSRFPEALNDAVGKLVGVMRNTDGVRDIEDSRPLPGIEWRILVDRAKAARFNADVSIVGSTVQLVTNGIKVGEYRPDDTDEEIEIRVRFPYSDRTLEQLDHLRIPSNQGNVPITNFITRDAGQKVGTIERTDLRRTVTVQADVDPGVLVSQKVAEIRENMQTVQIHPSVQFIIKGEQQDQDEAQAFLGRAFMIALFVMAIILVTQFNSFYQAFLILTAVIFSTGGVFLGHLLMAKPFGIVMSGIGVISLAGIVVNNNIVLIDTYNVLHRTGMPAYEAILRTGAQRLRPVLLTTVTTILGLMPMVLGMNIDLIGRHISIGGPSTQWWTQLSSSVAGGLAFATLLTLVLTPCLLMIQANFAQRRLQHAREQIAADDDVTLDTPPSVGDTAKA
ncbi:MAG: efflux RND transporter permease subunit [Gammaproteobacteria bacterium]|nr:efflux RND transporter permease subunit [Gammaproteobacteria bacterium]